MKAYEVAGCNLDGFRNWSGTVIDTEEKGVSEAIKKKFGLDYLYCEKFPNKKLQERGESQFRYSEIYAASVSLESLTVGELMGMIRHSGLSACMSGVTRNDVELISEDDRKEQKKQKWIPCVDHFPEDKRTVLICGDTGWVETGWRENGCWWTGFSLAEIQDDVVAWQPLPEPYNP